MQTFSFTGFAGLPALIDGGNVTYTLSAYLGGYYTQNDNATFTAEFLGAGMTPIGTAVLGPLLATDRGSGTGLFLRTLGGILPVGTQSVRFTLLMTRTDGSYNDDYADNLSFVLANGAPTSTVPEPSTWVLLAGGLGTIGAAGWRRRRALDG